MHPTTNVATGSHRPQSLLGNTGTTGSRVNWKRAFAVASLILALVLIVGAIYLHVQQKHRSVRLTVLAGADAAETTKGVPLQQPSNDDVLNPAQLLGLASGVLLKRLELASTGTATPELTEHCLQCVCDVSSDCRPTRCDNATCGPYRISLPYWLDAGQPTLEDTGAQLSQQTAYERCANNWMCAARCVTSYVSKYGRDCTGDGLVECRDHVLLHLHGPAGCRVQQPHPVFEQRMRHCLPAGN